MGCMKECSVCRVHKALSGFYERPDRPGTYRRAAVNARGRACRITTSQHAATLGATQTKPPHTAHGRQ